MSDAEFGDWWDAYRQQPWGAERDDFRSLAHALLATEEPPQRLVWPYWDDEVDDSPEASLARIEAHKQLYDV